MDSFCWYWICKYYRNCCDRQLIVSSRISTEKRRRSKFKSSRIDYSNSDYFINRIKMLNYFFFWIQGDIAFWNILLSHKKSVLRASFYQYRKTTEWSFCADSTAINRMLFHFGLHDWPGTDWCKIDVNEKCEGKRFNCTIFQNVFILLCFWNELQI